MAKAIIKRRVGGPTSPVDSVLTAGEIAQRLQPIAPDVAGTVQKIRYWQRREMMRPVAQVHAGTGKHFQYPANAVFDAAILHVTARAGVIISDHRHLVDALTLARFALPKWLAAKKRGHGPPLFLKIQQTNTRTEVEVNEHFPEPTHELSLVVDLNHLWSKLLEA